MFIGPTSKKWSIPNNNTIISIYTTASCQMLDIAKTTQLNKKNYRLELRLMSNHTFERGEREVPLHLISFLF